MMYLDTNIIVYAVENHPKYGKSCKRVLEDIEKERIKVSASVLVLVEAINVLNRLNKEQLKQRKNPKLLNLSDNILAIESLPITWLDLNFSVIERAAQYSYSINPTDYVHLASMELNQINEMISADGELDDVKWLARTDPLQYK